jgi:hypothetical protein
MSEHSDILTFFNKDKISIGKEGYFFLVGGA